MGRLAKTCTHNDILYICTYLHIQIHTHTHTNINLPSSHCWRRPPPPPSYISNILYKGLYYIMLQLYVYCWTVLSFLEYMIYWCIFVFPFGSDTTRCVTARGAGSGTTKPAQRAIRSSTTWGPTRSTSSVFSPTLRTARGCGASRSFTTSAQGA